MALDQKLLKNNILYLSKVYIEIRELNDKMYVNSRTYTQTYTPTVVQEGDGWTPPPRVFDMLQYFATILPSVESL